MMHRLMRGALGALALTTTITLIPSLLTSPAGAVPGPAPDRPPSGAAAGASAARWLGDELVKGRIPSQFPGFTDWGLTIDTAFALAADGDMPVRLARMRTAIENNYYDEYATFEDTISANAMSKTLVATRVLRANARDFGGHNVRRLVLNRIKPASAGFEAGRISDRGPSDFSNTFGQALGIIGLARSGDVPQSTVAYLLKQRCREGYFRISPVAGETCEQTQSPRDVDATALAIQALVAARADGATVPRLLVRRSATWLVSAQRANGSYGGGAGTQGSNANSTGLAAQALKATGRLGALGDARAWVKRMQLTRARVGEGPAPARSDVGAIGYNVATRNAALEDGITKATRDSFRRATAQGYLALVTRPLHVLQAP